MHLEVNVGSASLSYGGRRDGSRESARRQICAASSFSYGNETRTASAVESGADGLDHENPISSCPDEIERTPIALSGPANAVWLNFRRRLFRDIDPRDRHDR